MNHWPTFHHHDHCLHLFCNSRANLFVTAMQHEHIVLHEFYVTAIKSGGSEYKDAVLPI